MTGSRPFDSPEVATMKPRVTIAQLVIAVAFCGVAFAALRSPSYLWANALYTFVAVSLVLATINVLFSRGRSRAFWAGFLIAGGTYFVTYAVPGLRESICPRLLTEPLLDMLYANVAPSQPAPVQWMGGTLNGNTGMAMMTMMGGMYGTPVPAPAPTSRWAAWTEPERDEGVGHQIGSIRLVSSEPFRQIGHSLVILLFASLGGVYARHRFREGPT
jgi:hypothetical protein